MTQENDTTTERKLWFSGAWGRSLPTSFVQFGPDCIACRYHYSLFRAVNYFLKHKFIRDMGSISSIVARLDSVV